MIENKNTLVDIGCGNGYLTKKISENFEEITALDEFETNLIKHKHLLKVVFYFLVL